VLNNDNLNSKKRDFIIYPTVPNTSLASAQNFKILPDSDSISV